MDVGKTMNDEPKMLLPCDQWCRDRIIFRDNIVWCIVSDGEAPQFNLDYDMEFLREWSIEP